MVHFDAVEILIAYITGLHFNHDTISIKILVSPPMGEAMLPWQTLFKNSALFPAHSVSSALDTPDTLDDASLPITNADILKFLETTVSSNPQDALNTAKIAVKVVGRLKLDSAHTALVLATKKVELLGKSGLPGWHESAVKIILKIGNLETTVPASPNHVALVCDITHAVHLLVDSAKFYTELKGLQIFKGTLHCGLPCQPPRELIQQYQD